MNRLLRRRVSLVALGFSLPLVAFWWRNRALRSDAEFAPAIAFPPMGRSQREPFPFPNSGFSRSAPRASSAKSRVAVSGPPLVSMETVKLRRMGPVFGQNSWNDGDCEAETMIRVANVLAPEPAPFPEFESGQPLDARAMGEAARERVRRYRETDPRWVLRDAGGEKVMEMTPGGSGGSATTSHSGAGLGANSQVFLTRLTYGVQTRFDLDRVPLSRGVLTLGTDLKLPQGPPVPLQFEVRPAWFGRAPRTLQLASAQWRAPQSGDDGAIVVKVRERGARVTLQNEPQGSVIEWQVALEGKTRRAREIISERKLLYNWSPRLESEDGTYNSHAARDGEAWQRYRASSSARESSNPVAAVQQVLADFRPKIEAQTPIREGSSITLVYRFFGLKNVPGAPIFKTEVGVPGDGFLKVSVPLPQN